MTAKMKPMRRIGAHLFFLSALLTLAACKDENKASTENGANSTYFTETQATRGKTVFDAHCSACHGMDAKVQRSPMVLAGDAFLRRWHSVNDLYGKISETMPADKVLSLSQRQTLDVVAYLLEANGLKAGSKELGPDRSAMHGMALASSAPVSSYSQSAVSDTGYYSAAQAMRGEQFFNGSCATCHIAEPKPRKAGDPTDPVLALVSLVDSGGIAMGPIHAKSHLAGPGFLDKWSNVGALYKRIKYTMPGHEPAGLDDETYRDIVAYLLKTNGLPEGKHDLPMDQDRLDAMPLVEPGFQPMFNGEDFSGFHFLLGSDCKPAPEGCGSTEPGQTFGIEKGTIYTTGHPFGYMYTAKKYLNFTMRFEYRFPPDPGARPEDVFWGNSGYLLFITENQVWPKCIEIEGQEVIQLRPLGLATAPVYTYDEDAYKRARRPIGEWNTVEIASKDGEIRSSLNGVLLSVVTQHEFKEPGYIGFQAEGARIYWRNMRIKEE